MSCDSTDTVGQPSANFSKKILKKQPHIKCFSHTKFQILSFRRSREIKSKNRVINQPPIQLRGWEETESLVEMLAWSMGPRSVVHLYLYAQFI